jgi:2-polyprenyl-3-methyl-5-hydroxy-6-metoxy-1,4-benzoquinol methylase
VSESAYLTYYGTHGIVPVRQDTSDLELHYARRRALYRHLGIPPLLLRNRRILEFGPGTGDNALYLAACEPELCVLVDANPASIQAISDKLAQGLFGGNPFECRMSDIRDYADTRRFDFVLCEGVMPGQENPDGFLHHVASFVDRDGIVVITTISATSVLAEVCRRVIKAVVASRITDRDRLLEELTRFFQPDLDSLPAMSRRHEDWVLDNILHPWPARVTFTIPEAIDILDPHFDLLGTSPSFMQDWRWHKAIPRHPKTWNDVAREEYRRWEPFLIDYRLQPSDRIPAVTAGLEAACHDALRIHHEIWRSNSLNEFPQFSDCLLEIRAMIVGPAPETARAITDFLAGFEKFADGDSEAAYGSFRSWFGRGQQYVSFSRK